jgi:hypothetical protein
MKQSIKVNVKFTSAAYSCGNLYVAHKLRMVLVKSVWRAQIPYGDRKFCMASTNSIKRS